MIIKFKGIPPSLKNSKTMVCRGRTPMLIPSKAYKEWHIRMTEEFKNVSIPEDERGPNYVFTYKFYIPFNKDGSISGRPFDYSNKIESINDLLVDLKIIEDDNYNIISEQHIYGDFVPYGEGCVVLEIN